MESVEVTQRPVIGRGRFLAPALVCGIAAGFVAASAPAVFPPVAVAAATVATIAAATIVAVVGLTGLAVLVPVTFAFFLMNRFDEALAIHIGIYTIKVSYWVAPVSLGTLAIMAVFRREQAGSLRTPLAHAPGWLMVAWTAFTGLGLLSIVGNTLGDRYIAGRSVLGEMLALGSVCIPIRFAVLIPITPLSKQRTLWCIRFMTGLALLTAFIMTVFAVLPQQVSGMLGWAKVLGSSGGLVRGSTPLGHANTVAGVLLLFLPMAIVIGVRHYSLFWTLYYLGGALFLMGGILFSLSRTTLAVAIPVVACACSTCSQRGLCSPRRRSWSRGYLPPARLWSALSCSRGSISAGSGRASITTMPALNAGRRP